MYTSLLKVILKRKGLLLLLLSAFIISLMMFQILIQVHGIVNRTLEQDFREYRPQVVYYAGFSPLPMENGYAILPNKIKGFLNFVSKYVRNDSIKDGVAVSFSSEYLLPLVIKGDRVYPLKNPTALMRLVTPT